MVLGTGGEDTMVAAVYGGVMNREVTEMQNVGIMDHEEQSVKEEDIVSFHESSLHGSMLKQVCTGFLSLIDDNMNSPQRLVLLIDNPHPR